MTGLESLGVGALNLIRATRSSLKRELIGFVWMGTPFYSKALFC